jgi:hypothetical protein
MTRLEAADILDPKTTSAALRPYAYDRKRRFAVVEDACALAAEELRNSCWVPVKERLPEQQGEYLVCYGGKKIETRMFLGGSFRRNYESVLSIENLTHWMPLPEPPETELHETKSERKE